MKIKDNLEYYSILIFRAMLSILPLKLRYQIFESIGMLSYYIIKKRRILTLDNIRNAFPEKTEKEIIRIAKESYKTMAKMIVVSTYLKEVNDREDTVIENQELLEEELKKGKGAILLSLHLGAFESGSKMCKGKNFYAVFRSQKNKKINDLMTKYRSETGMKTIITGDAETTNKAISEKAILALIADHYKEDIEIDFFGRKAYAASGTVLLAAKYKKPVIFTYAIFENYKIKIILKEVLEIEKKENLKETLQYNTQVIFNKFEDVIKRYPDQYMWQHKRWRK